MNALTLETSFAGLSLKNPLIAASGTFGFGEEYAAYFDLSLLGGIATKGLTLNPKDGNSGIRVWETQSGMLNSIGLQNPGVEAFIGEILPVMKTYGTAIIVNLGGNTLEEYYRAIELLNEVDFELLELNISCPNVKEGGMAFGIHTKDVAHVVGECRKRTKHRLMVKLSPNAENITECAVAAEANGADALSLINTIQAMDIDVAAKKPVFDNVYAGLSGPAILPIALRMVHSVAKKVSIPISGIGGVQTYEDVLKFLMAGATTVQVGSSVFSDPLIYPRLLEGLHEYCFHEGISSLHELIGII
jgi:dihydroorotate dehydrogenase (NAD+) catalytic subunit